MAEAKSRSSKDDEAEESPEAAAAKPKRPEIIWLGGGSDQLQLKEGGPIYYPGQHVPASAAQRASLAMTGHRFASRHGDETTPIGPQGMSEIQDAERAAHQASSEAATTYPAEEVVEVVPPSPPTPPEEVPAAESGDAPGA